ncbi:MULTISPECIES: class A beta-lactamase [unclassified Microbacterium]|uniref:class A beta-lactamase n=1 Tax=unclassified Microbacterium TaxID=2609290 RepID=UPI000EA883CA|nr:MULTISPECIES: class A beta-lactamase [unclassified Microbacterium]MBT2486439.1 class A beta-lactamase [Microbacterium sp. ISL-108]RKN69139.1 class A beta-lactamase [Microbacterium sp. CGR2]
MRRLLTAGLTGLFALTALTGCVHSPDEPTTPSPARPTTTPSPELHADTEQELVALEQEYNATIGVVAVNTGTGESVSYGENRRFGFASTIKAFAAAEFLRTVQGPDRDELVHWTADEADASGNAPVTSQHVEEGLTYAQLAEAAVRFSDNAALNLVFDRIGGPQALDDALTDLGDTTTEVVNNEPTLNTIEPDSTEDTTTAAAFTASFEAYLDGSTLTAADTALLLDWMSDNRTGDPLIRAGAPAGWVVADKSGGAGPIRNDIAMITPPGEAPILLTVLTSRNDPDAAFDNTLVARTASTMLNALGPTS